MWEFDILEFFQINSPERKRVDFQSLANVLKVGHRFACIAVVVRLTALKVLFLDFHDKIRMVRKIVFFFCYSDSSYVIGLAGASCCRCAEDYSYDLDLASPSFLEHLEIEFHIGTALVAIVCYSCYKGVS